MTFFQEHKRHIHTYLYVTSGEGTFFGRGGEKYKFCFAKKNGQYLHNQ